MPAVVNVKPVGVMVAFDGTTLNEAMILFVEFWLIKPATGWVCVIVARGAFIVCVLLAGAGFAGPAFVTVPVLVKLKLESAVVVILTVLPLIAVEGTSLTNKRYPVDAAFIDIPVPLILIVVPVPVAATVPISVAPVKLFELFWYNLKFVMSVVAA